MSASTRAARVAAGGIAVCVFACMLAMPAVAIADTIYVDVNEGTDASGLGTTERPYQTIGKGLAEASPGDTVKVADGVYQAPLESFPIVMPKGVTLQGDSRGAWKLPPFMGTVVKSGTSTAFRVINADENTVIDGLEFRDINAAGFFGGALFISGGSAPGYGPQIRDCTFYECSSAGGGAAYVSKGAAPECNVTFTRCEFEYCTADQGGGGVHSDHAGVVFDDCQAYACGALNTTVANGGFVKAAYATDLVFRDCLIVGCYAASSYSASPGPTQSGGALYVFTADRVRMERTKVHGSKAANGGGLYLSFCSDGRIINSVLQGNQATQDGGAVRNNSSTLSVDHATVFGNQAGTGAGGVAQGIIGSCAITNSILWDNGDDQFGCTLADTCIEDIGDSGPGVIHDDPQFETVGPYSWRITWDSPCVDAGGSTVIMDDMEGNMRPYDGDGDGTPAPDIGCYEIGVIADRAGGANRYETAVLISREHYGWADVAVLATGRDYPDALTAAGLAGAADGPVLLTTPDSIPDSVVDELERLETEKVYIVGGTGVVYASAEAQLEELGFEVQRLAGADRYATSEAVARECAALLGTPGPGIQFAWICRGDLFPDALAVSPIAAQTWAPIVLTRPDALPGSTASVLSDLGVADAAIAGGTGAVSEEVETVVRAIVGNVDRVAGANRYETAVQIATYARGRWPYQVLDDFIGLAVGTNFPDALAGGAATGARRGVLLLTPTDELPTAAAADISAHADYVRHLQAFGGTSVVSNDVLVQARNLLH